MGTFFHQIQSYIISYSMKNAWIFQSISHSINSRHDGTKSKIYQKKKRTWMQFHQKRGVQIYIRQKYTTLQKNFLTFNNQLQKLQLLPKTFNEKRNNRGICQEKDSQFNSHFSLPYDVAVILLHHSLALSYWIHWHCEVKLLLFSMIKLDSFTSIREKNSFQSFLF